MNTKQLFTRVATSTALAGTLVFSTIGSAAAAPLQFTDVSQNYEEAVRYLVDNQISMGKTSTQFGVGENITRGDAAILLAKALEIDELDAPASGFMDVPARGSKAISALKHKGVVNGKSAKQFGFYDLITRGEMALMLAKVNAYNLKDEAAPLNFTDVNSRYAEAVKGMVKYGITSGKTATRFGTDDSLQRGEYAIFIHRAEMNEADNEQDMIKEAEVTIAALPLLKELKFSDEPAIQAARSLVDSVLAINEQAAISELTKLEELEKSLTSWKDKKDASEAAIAKLPALDKLTVKDVEAVGAARKLVDEVLSWDESAVIAGIDSLVKAEQALAQLNLEELIAQAEAAIKDLPALNDLKLTDEAAIQAAFNLIEQIKAVDKDAVIEGIPSLEAAAAKMEELKDAAEISDLIEQAEAAITSLPEITAIQLSDLSKVEQARLLVNQAIEKDADAVFSNIDQLIAAEEKIETLKQAEQLKAETSKAEAAIASLPELADLTSAHTQQVNNARALVEKVYAMDAQAIIQGIDNLEAAESRIAELYKPTLFFSSGKSSINDNVTQLSLSFVNQNPETLTVKQIEVFNDGISKNKVTEEQMISSGIPTTAAKGEKFSIAFKYGILGRPNGSLPLYAVIKITDGKKDYTYEVHWD